MGAAKFIEGVVKSLQPGKDDSPTPADRQDFIASHRRTPASEQELKDWVRHGRPGSWQRESKQKGYQ